MYTLPPEVGFLNPDLELGTSWARPGHALLKLDFLNFLGLSWARAEHEVEFEPKRVF